MSSFAIGVDLGGTNLRVAAVTEDGKLLEKVTLGTQVSRGRDAVIDAMCEAILGLLAKFSAANLLGVGIGVPGIIDKRSGLLRESPNLPGWEDYPVRDEIERRLKAPVVLENDANAAALGEAWLGAAKNAESMCMITLGTGVGGGIVLNGEIWHGMSGMAGELGHVTVNPEGPRCNCGNRGCVEQYASASAIMRMARQAIADGKDAVLTKAASDPEFSARVVYNLATQGNEAAKQIFHEAGKMLGIVVADLINVLNLHMYVVGGGAASAWSAFSPAMFEEVRLRSMVYAATAPPDREGETGASAEVKPTGRPYTIITHALLGSDAGLYGAARLPMIGKTALNRQTAG